MDPGSREYEELQCPVCFEIPDDQIFLCQNGHTICGKCSEGVQICPQCRVSLAKIKVRNRSLELLLDTLTFGCSNKGCKEKVGRKSIQRHAIDCVHSGKRVDLCKKIGFHQCDYSTNLLDLKAAIYHFTTVHDIPLSGGDESLAVTLDKFDKAAFLKIRGKFVSSMWSPVIVDLSLSNNPEGASSSSGTGQVKSNAKVMLLSSVHGRERSASWMCVCLSPEPEAAQLHVEFCIKSLSANIPDLLWQTPTIDPAQLDTMLQMAPLRLPVNQLLTHYTRKTDGVCNLVVNCRVIKINGKPKQNVGAPIRIFNRQVRANANDYAENVPSRPFLNAPIQRPWAQPYVGHGMVFGHSDQCNCIECWQYRDQWSY